MLCDVKITLIAAMDRHRAIGKSGDLPWHIPSDLKFFKAQTLGKTMVMGRKTYASIGRPLPGRTTLILSRSGFQADGCQTVPSLSKAAQKSTDGQLIVAGGGEIYKEALPVADELILTHVDTDVAGDTFFPDFEAGFTRHSSQAAQDEKTGIALEFVTYKRG